MNIIIFEFNKKTKTGIKWQKPGLKRKDENETILNRIRIGHTFTTHTLPYSQKLSPYTCESCGVYYTVEHILTECLKFENSRHKHHTIYLMHKSILPVIY